MLNLLIVRRLTGFVSPVGSQCDASLPKSSSKIKNLAHSAIACRYALVHGNAFAANDEMILSKVV